MKNLIILSLLCAINLEVHAKTKNVKVLVVDPEADTTELEKEYTVEKEAKTNLALPDVKERDKFFEGTTIPTSWDDLKKDVFFMELSSKSVAELVKKYPEIKESDIKKLKGKK